VAELLMIISDF